MIKRILLLLLVVVSLTAKAQYIKSQSTFRLLQTANSLMEAQQMDAAEEYFKKGLSKAAQFKDEYCIAYGNQGLGNLYNKLDQKDKAIACYQTALKSYKAQKLTVLANLTESFLKSAQGIGDLYAGIEIGAKGVKMSVVEVKLSKDREYDYTLQLDTAINTDAASLSYQSEKETYDALVTLNQLINDRFKISPKRVYIVISSGLKQELDKYNKVDYFANIIRPKVLDTATKITYITPIQEAELSLMGIVPQRDRFTTSQIDVGSGNTKGGYFNENRQFIPVTIPLGTKSFQRLVDGRMTGDINQFADAAAGLIKDSVANAIEKELANKTSFQNRDVVYLSGGIVWAVASFMHPAELNKNYVDLTSKDISDFRKMLLDNYDELTQPAALRAMTNSNDALIARNNISRVMKTYDRRAMTAGAILLDEVIRKINALNPNKKFVYPRYAYVGWISGYIIKKATQQYSSLLTSNR